VRCAPTTLAQWALAAQRQTDPRQGMTTSSDLAGVKWMKTRVQSYTGYHDESEPRSFDLGNQRLEVVEILERFHSPEHRYFKVKVTGTKFYFVRYGATSKDWEIAPYIP
jgi:hypothetical protein